MSAQQFQSSIANSKTQPKGFKVGPDLLLELKAAGLIEMKDIAAWSVFDLGFQMPFYQSCCLICHPGFGFLGRVICFRQTQPNMAVDLAPFGRWTRRDKAAHRRLPLR